MGNFEKALKKLNEGTTLRIDEGKLIARHYFGKPRKRGSHNIYSLPWQNTLLNIQADKSNKMKHYQQGQLKKFVNKLNDEEKKNVNKQF